MTRRSFLKRTRDGLILPVSGDPAEYVVLGPDGTYRKGTKASASADPAALAWDYRRGTVSARELPAGAPFPAAIPSRERDPSKLPWLAPIRIEENTPSTYSQWLQTDGSILIPDRFTRSDNPDVNPVHIRTTRPVILQGGATFGKGQPATGANAAILLDTGNANITVREHLIFGTHPQKTGYSPVRAVNCPYGFVVFHLQNVEAYGTGGFVARRDDNSTARIQRLVFKQMYLKNLDGRVADTTKPGGWRTGNLWGNGAAADFVIANILQLIDVRMDWVDVLDISHIENENEAGHSRFEDAWAFQRSGGSGTKEMLLQYIKMRGCYVYDEAYDGTQPWYGNNGPVGPNQTNDPTGSVDATGRFKDARGKVHSGGHGLYGDGIDGATALDHISRNVRFKKVYALDFANYGLAIQSGVDSVLEDAVAARSGYVHNLRGGRTVKIPTKHLPLQLQYGPGGSAPDRSRWGGHTIRNTRFGQKSFSPYNGSAINEGANPDGTVYKITPNCTENGVVKPAFTEIGNTYLPDVTPDMVDGFWRELDAYWAANRIAIGLADRIPVAP